MGLYRSPEGVVTEIDDDSASALVAGGYVPISSAQAGALRESAASGGITGAINAGATSVLSGATLGLSDVALKAFMNRGEAARLAADREANPVVSGVGQFVGAIVPSLAAPETLLAKAPSAVLSRAVAPLVERGGVAALVGSGLEGSAYGAGAYLSDMALGDRKLSAEGLAGALGGGFAFGVGGGAAAMGIEKGAIAARRMFARVADGGERAAAEAEQLWRATHQTTLETYDAAADIAKANLAKARATRESAGLARDQASAAHAELSALRPELDAAHAAATGLDAKIAAIEAADAPAASINLGSMEELDRLVAEHFQAKSELDDLLQRIEAPDLGGFAPPGLGVPVGEFGPIGARGVQSSQDMARRALVEATPPGAMDATGAAAPKALREVASGTPAGRAIEPSIPTYEAIKAHEVKADDYLEQVVSAKSIADRGYYEPSGAGVDPVRVAKAKSAVADGQRDPIKLNISPEGKITVTDGRHRLAAAIEADAPVKVKWSTGLAPAADDVERGARAIGAASVGAESGTRGAGLSLPIDAPAEVLVPSAGYESIGNTHWESLRDDAVARMTPQQRNAMKAYSHGSDASVNIALEQGRQHRWVPDLDEALSQSPAEANIEVFRGVRRTNDTGSKEYMDRLRNAKPGQVIASPGYLSTSASETEAAKFLSGKRTDRVGSIAMSIEVPKGHPLLPIAGLKDHELEFLLPRDTKLQILAAEEVGGQYSIRARVIGGQPPVAVGSFSGDLEALLRGTSERLAAGEDLNVIGAPARAEYVAAKANRGKAFAERSAPSPEVDTAKESARRRLGIGEHRRVYRRLELAQDAALERAVVAAEPAERAAALAEAHGIEQQLTGMGPAPAAASDDIARIAPAITKYERKSAELVEVLGDVAPPLAREQAAAFRAAEDAADRKIMDRATRAVDDGIEMPQVGRDRRPSANAPAAPKLVTSKQEMRNADAAYKRARAIETEAKIGAKSAAEQAKTARATAGAPPTPTPGKPSMLGAIATAVGLAGELGIPGVPKPHDIPVIGPLLSAYIKYRALKATAGRFVGRVAATGDTRAAALVARTKDKIATAVDRSLGLVAAAAPRARPGFVAASGVIGRRLFDDGAPDAPKDASRQEQAAVRIREIITAASRPDMITALVRREMHDVVDPDLIAAAEQHLIARFAHLADVVPKPPPDNAYAQRPWTPSPSATHELEQRLAVIHDPALALAVIHDPQHALSSPAAADTFRKAHPELFELAKQRLIGRLDDMEEPMPRDARLRASAFFQIPLDISLDPSHIAIVRAPEPPEPHPSPTGAFSVAKMYDPLNTRGR